MMKKFRFIVIVIAMMTMAGTQAQGTINVEGNGMNGLDILENSYFEFSGTFSVSTFTAVEVNTEAGLFTRLSLPGSVHTNLYGHPEMPASRKLISVPLGAEAVVTLNSIEYEDIDLRKAGYPEPVYPAQPPRIKSQDEHEFILDPAAYALNGFEKHELVTVDMLGILRDKRIARINFVPFQYDPIRHVVRVFHRIDFSVSFENADIPATLALEENYASPAFRSVNRFLANARPESNRENFKRYPVKYVIVSDRMFESQLQEFIEWKIQKGFMVVEAYTDEPGVGNSLSSIKTYLQGLYNAGTVDDPAPSYVLFVGDIQQIPAYNNGNGATDRNYFEYTGDLFPEIYYGRFSAQNPGQLQPYIDKTLQYEKYTMPDPTYLDEVVMVAGMDAGHGYDWANGQINYGTINYFNLDHGIISHTYLYPQSGSNAAQIRQDISNGVTFGNYTAHCSPSGWADPSFTLSDIPNLQNEEMYCVLVGNCCSSSEYQLNECFGEAIVRTANKGAVGYIGASNSTYWDEDYYFGVGVGAISQNPPPYSQTSLGYYDRAFHDHGEEFGEWYVSGDEMIFAGNLAVTEGAPGSAQYYWDIYNYMGDPSLMVYFSNPPATTADYMPLLPLQSTSFEVTTEPYAYVALSLDNEFIGAALANENGEALLEFPPLTEPGEGDVVVTRQNGQPFFGTVLIASPSGPYLILDDVAIGDAGGNNNGFADFGESISLDVSVENAGNGDALGTISTLTGSDPYITVTKDMHQWPDIPGLANITENGTFEMEIAADVPDQQTVNFEISFESQNKEVWNYTYDLVINAPVLTIGSMVIDDSQSGNNNGRLDPGETAMIKIVNRNTGHAETHDALATISTMCQYITLSNTSYEVGTLGLLGYKYAQFEVSVDPDAPDGAAIAQFDYTLGSGEYSATKQFNKKIGIILEDFETGDFSKFDWVMGGDLPWQITNMYPYEGSFSARSGDIADGQKSELKITVDVMIADTISFVYKVSSQLNKDKLKFYIGNSMQGEWSGVGGGWNEVSVYIPTGVHTLKWVYEKDVTGWSGDDCAWLDMIEFPPLMTLTCYAGPDDYTCTGNDFQCHGQATDWISVEWSTSGDGTFDDPSILEPVYTPGSNDIANGGATLMLAATDDEGSNVDDEMELSIMDSPPGPDMPAGPQYVNLNVTSVSEYETTPVPYANHYTWSVDPAAAGDISGLGTTGTITWNPEFLGTAVILVKAVNNCGESEYSDGLEVTVDNVVSLPEYGSELEVGIFPNPGKGVFNLTLHAQDNGLVYISIYDVNGTLVHRETAMVSGHRYNGNIDLGDQPAGMYFVKVRNDRSMEVTKLLLDK